MAQKSAGGNPGGQARGRDTGAAHPTSGGGKSGSGNKGGGRSGSGARKQGK